MSFYELPKTVDLTLFNLSPGKGPLLNTVLTSLPGFDGRTDWMLTGKLQNSSRGTSWKLTRNTEKSNFWLYSNLLSYEN